MCIVCEIIAPENGHTIVYTFDNIPFNNSIYQYAYVYMNQCLFCERL